jgi:hypothetical protein
VDQEGIVTVDRVHLDIFVEHAVTMEHS